MSDEVDYLLSILRKEWYVAMAPLMPTDPADKDDAGKFLDYLVSTWIMRYLPVLESMSWKISK